MPPAPVTCCMQLTLQAHEALSCLADQVAFRDQALELLKRGWPPGDSPRYDADHALVLCRMHAFTPGLLFLYEQLRLFREVLHVRPLPYPGPRGQQAQPVSFARTGPGLAAPVRSAAPLQEHPPQSPFPALVRVDSKCS